MARASAIVNLETDIADLSLSSDMLCSVSANPIPSDTGDLECEIENKGGIAQASITVDFYMMWAPDLPMPPRWS